MSDHTDDVVTPFRPMAHPLEYPLPEGARPTEVLQRLESAANALAASRESLTRIQQQLREAARALPLDTDLHQLADLWYDENVRPLRARGVFSEQWEARLMTYADAFTAIAEILPEWAPVAARANEILESHADLEKYRDELVSVVLGI